MRAALYHSFGGPISVESVPDPTPEPDGAVIRVLATGVCRSDWHGWRGHDPDIRSLPHVPGHELAGEVVAVGRGVRQDWLGQRVTLPFVAGCGACPECNRGNQHVCDRQFQPGFTAWGSFAELVAVRYADGNLIPLADSLDCVTAASLGCRFSTAYRAVALQGRLAEGQWLAVFGCGGVGLSAVMIAAALDAQVVAVDVREEPLALAKQLGATVTINSLQTEDVPSAIRDTTRRGADVALDAVGSSRAMAASILSLRKRGRHVQVGLLAGPDSNPSVPMERVVAWELELLGSHGLQAYAYAPMLQMIEQARLDPKRLLERTIPLNDAPQALAALDQPVGCGVTIITP